MTGGTVLTGRREGPVLVATLNRPGKSNAINRDILTALDGMAANLETPHEQANPARALVLTGAGAAAFSAGADVSELADLDIATAREQMRRGQRVFDRIERLPIVVIAAINGLALGGGLELAMAADLRVAVPAARLGQPEITLGNLPGWGGTQRLPRLIGRGRATELILTGELISAQRAFDLGLVNQVSDDPVRASIDLAARITARSPAAVAGAKRAIRTGLDEGAAAGLLAEAEAVAECCQTSEQKTAVRAFLTRHR